VIRVIPVIPVIVVIVVWLLAALLVAVVCAVRWTRARYRAVLPSPELHRIGQQLWLQQHRAAVRIDSHRLRRQMVHEMQEVEQ
jgi:hypothetical protein